MIPSTATVRDAVRAGRWGVLDIVAATGAPYRDKASLGLVAAEEAARLLATAPDTREQIQRYFCVDQSRVLISSFGLDRGQGTLAVSPDGVTTSEDDQFGAIVERLAVRHGWGLPDDRVARLRVRFPGFFGLGRYEFDSLLHSPEAQRLSAPELAEVVYPLWKPRAMGITLTYRCNASCAHCFNVSGPKRSADCLGWSETGEHLTDWVRVGVSDIGLSGGEPFLYPDLIIEMVGQLRTLGVKLISPFTNGFWGDDEPAAREVLTRLRQVGFGDHHKDQIKISAGEFHAPFIATSAVLNLATLHHEIIGNPVIMDMAYVRSDEELRRLVSEAKQRGIEDKIQWMARTAVSDSGRAKRWYDSLSHHERPLSEMRCPVKASASLYPSGDWVYCSGTSWPTDYRKIGGLRGDSPFTILARTQRDPRVPYWQFGTFADWLADNPRPGYESGTASMPARATVCGVCRDLFAPKRTARADVTATVDG